MGELNLERSKVKFDTWERKLLDLSTRNSLLNLRIKGSCIPLFVPECSHIEDLIAQDKSFSIKSRGSEELTEETEATEELPEAVKPAEDKPEETTEPEVQALPAESSAPAEALEEPVQESAPEAALAVTSEETPAVAEEPENEKKEG